VSGGSGLGRFLHYLCTNLSAKLKLEIPLLPLMRAQGNDMAKKAPRGSIRKEDMKD
jgi:hypothetical protein